MQVGSVVASPPAGLPPPFPDELKDARCCKEELPKRNTGRAELFPPSQRRRGQEPKRPRQPQQQALSLPATLAPRGRNAQTALPATCSVRPPGRGQRRPGELRGGRTREAKSNFGESERYSRKTHGGRGLRAEK